MLEFFPISNPDSIFKWIQSEDLQSQTWIVSDLKSKNEIQKLLIEKQGFFLESSILRASDFWKIALRRIAPQVQIVSNDFIQIVVDNFVAKYQIELSIKAYESTTLMAYLQELAPILLHPESDSLLSEWFSKQTKIKKWQRWHLMSRACMKYIIQQHQIIDSRWIAAYLQTLDITQFAWPSELIVDLGTEMSSIEFGLFKTLSKKNTVQIIWPNPEWGSRYPLLLKTYQDNAGYGLVVKNNEELVSSEKNETQFIRVSTQLSEVKYAVSQIRKWHDVGVSLDNIAVLSPQIENYWFVLKYFLDQEGLSYQKDHIVKINSLGLVQNFLSYCTNLQSDVSWDSLEASLYSREVPSDIGFESFKSLFYQLYDDSDLLRDEKIKNLFYKKIDLTKEINRDEFLLTAVKLWNTCIQFHALSHQPQHSDLFELIFKDFLARSSDVISSFKNWLQFLQSCINSKELKIEFGSVDGLQILPLMSSHLSSCKYQIWLGLDEKSLSSQKKHLIPVADIFELKNQFDFSIDYPEESFYDFNIRWLQAKNAQIKIYLCANSSFESEPLTPSLFFLENNKADTVELPELTRHDEIQNFLSQINFIQADHQKKSTKYDFNGLDLVAIQRDLQPQDNIVVGQKIDSISASELEEYWKCGFKLLAQKVFHLRDLPQVAVDLDPRQKGSLLHQLFEYLILQKELDSDPDRTKKGIEDFLDTKRISFNIYPQEDLVWNLQKTKLTQIGIAFHSFENQRAKTTHLASEKSFELVFDLNKKEFKLLDDEDQLGVKIKGRIDRLDKNSNGIIIYDYKASAVNLRHHTGWLENGEFQLLLYLIACEKILHPDQDVVASVYYDYKKFDLSKGYMRDSFHEAHIINNRKKKAVASAEDIASLVQSFNLLLDTLFQKLMRSDFSPIPQKLEICDECNWSKLCRAHHLK